MAQTETAEALKRTPLTDIHAALGAKLVPFAGYLMPVQYLSGITAEHNAVRKHAGLFDVSHMGEFIVRGPGAVDFVNFVTTNDVSALAVGQAHYSTILNDRGTIEDDCLVYRDENQLMMVVNASNATKDFAHISRHLEKFDATLEDVSDETALLAIQGPKAAEVLQRLTDADLSAVKYYHFTFGSVAGVPGILISRTGYTGEDGFQLYFPNENAAAVWNAILAEGGVMPAGLGSRDSLRLEMGMALYGNDIDDTTTPLEANLQWLVKLKKGDFVGREALVRQKEAGIQRKLIGFTATERAFPRHGYPVYVNGERSGDVRSGTMSPSLNIPIGTAYVPTASASPGSELEIEIRGKRIRAVVEKTPFYKNGTHL